MSMMGLRRIIENLPQFISEMRLTQPEGAPVDEPEGVRYVRVSETLWNQIADVLEILNSDGTQKEI